MDEVERLQQRIQELEKELKELRRDVSVIAYDLRCPLTPIMGFVRTLLDDESEKRYTQEDRREFCDIIEQNIDRLSSLIFNLQGRYPLQKIDTDSLVMDWQPDVDILKIIEYVVIIKQGHTDKHAFVIDFDPEKICIETDPEQFAEIFHILIYQAIKYSPEGGEIRVIARLEPPNKAYPCGSLLMQVKDQGISISMDDMPKLGEMFIDGSKAIGQNRPPGLFLVRTIVEMHHGVLWFDSEGMGNGRTANVRIPVKQSLS